MNQSLSLQRVCAVVLAVAVTILFAAACEKAEKQPIQNPPAAKKVDPCALDTERLCKGVKPGQGRIVACLKKQQPQLSQACRQSLNKKVPAKKTVVKKKKVDPCAQDLKTICKGIKPGEGRLAACLKNNVNKLSPGCKKLTLKIIASEKQAANKQKKAAAVNPCKGDIAKFCAEIKPGEGRIDACLLQNNAQISVECQKALSKRLAAAAPTQKDPCVNDLEKFCKDVSGKESALGCLRQHQQECSSACRKFLEGV